MRRQYMLEEIASRRLEMTYKSNRPRDPAIDANVLSGDVASFRREQKADCFCDLVHRAITSHGDSSFTFFYFDQTVNESRHQVIHPNSLGSVLIAIYFSKTRQRS